VSLLTTKYQFLRIQWRYFTSF